MATAAREAMEARMVTDFMVDMCCVWWMGRKGTRLGESDGEKEERKERKREGGDLYLKEELVLLATGVR